MSQRSYNYSSEGHRPRQQSSRRQYPQGDAYATGTSWSNQPGTPSALTVAESAPRGPIDSMTAAGIPQFLSRALREMQPAHPLYRRAQEVRRLLYDPGYTPSYNANDRIYPNAVAIGEVSSQYRPFRSNNTIIDNLHAWIREVGVVAGLEKYARDLVTGIADYGDLQIPAGAPRVVSQAPSISNPAYIYEDQAAAYQDMIAPEVLILSAMHRSETQGREPPDLIEESLYQAASAPGSTLSTHNNAAGNIEQIDRPTLLLEVCDALRAVSIATLSQLSRVPTDISQAPNFRSQLAAAVYRRAAPTNYVAGLASGVIGVGGQVQTWAPQPYVKGVTAVLAGLLGIVSLSITDKRAAPEGRLAALSSAKAATVNLEEDMTLLLIAYVELYEAVAQILATRSRRRFALTPSEKENLRRLFANFKRHFSALKDDCNVSAGYNTAEKAHRSQHPKRSVEGEVLDQMYTRGQHKGDAYLRGDGRSKDAKIRQR